MLSKSKKITTSLTNVGIALKSDNAKYQIVKVCNPYCPPCEKAHPILDELYHIGLIDLQILFTAKPDEQDKKYKPVSHLLAINELEPNTTVAGLDAWYMADKKEYETFASKYPINGALQQQKEKIQKMSDWYDKEEITHTPTIFVNGFKLTKEYTIEDLKEVLQ